MLNIEWKPIKDYEDLYMVSNTGLIKSLHWGKEKLLKPVIRSNTYQYYFVGLLKDNKRRYFAVHRLVAQAFLPNPNNYEQVDHLDGNKLNNNVNNLEWVSAKENTNRAWSKGLAKNSEYQRKISRATMLERWKNNNHRKCNGIKRTKEEKREYHRNYYKKHKQMEQMAYKVGE